MGEMETARPIVTLSEAQAFARVETGEEEAIIAGLVRTASALCEAFLGQIVIERPFAEQLPASNAWQRLQVMPVRSIDAVVQGDEALPATDYAIDIDSDGQGWVRLIRRTGGGPVEVRGSAGITLSQNGVPEPIRHGVLRLVTHLFAARDGAGGEIPAAVTALWRPYRLMRLA